MSFPSRDERQIPRWVLIPILLFGVGGGFLVWEQAQPEAREERAHEVVRGRIERANALIDSDARVRMIASALAGIPERDDPSARMLAVAIQAGDDAAVRDLLGRVPAQTRADQMATIGRCFQRGDIGMVRTLLDGGVPPQALGRGPLPGDPIETAPSSNMPMGGGAMDDPVVPLVEAIVYRSVDGARLLLAHGADPDRTVICPTWMAERVAKGKRVGGPVGGRFRGGRPLGMRIEPSNDRIYTIRQLASLCDDPALRAAFRDLTPSRKATRITVRTSE